ncbi:hypothetical protein BVG19_g1297 [[Candida] boidinii]|nr:hypothetical protein BVG19_g1297 [[Candida] boidinii]OWB49078.1 hypothetical protein B5S27_g617 [[Candida] boidinii]
MSVHTLQDDVRSFTGSNDQSTVNMNSTQKTNNINDDDNDNDDDDDAIEQDGIQDVIHEGGVHIDSFNPQSLSRLSTLSKTVSHLNAKEMENFKIDVNDFNLIKILNFLQRKDDENGLSNKSIDLIFKNFKIIGKNTTASKVKATSDLLLTPYTLIKNAISNSNNNSNGNTSNGNFLKQSKTRQIIRNVTGYIKPGEMLLVLGRPGAGCSTLLKGLTGETQAYLKTEGSVTYNGIDQATMMQRFKNQVIYNPELDVHYPHLTVEQTLKFAIACRTPRVRFDNVSREDYINSILELWSTVFGLTHVYKTKVGNDYVRGISGGQRKRVSIAEAMVSRASMYAFDNATRGLDASTALEFIETLRAATNITRSTSVVTIYQAGEAIYELFDNVTVLYSGRQIYFGPIDKAKQFFIDMGFECPPRQTTSEFLTSITDPNGRTAREGYENLVPITSAEFEQYWHESDEYKNLLMQIEVSENVKDDNDRDQQIHNFELIKSIEKSKYTSKKSKYTIDFVSQFILCSKRSYMNVWNNLAFTMINLCFNVIVQCLIIGSCLYDLPNNSNGIFSRGGAIYLCLLHFVFTGLYETIEAFNDRVILQKQFGYSFYHPSAEALANIFSLVPLRIIFITIFNIVVYFLANLRVNAGCFFIFELFIILTVQCMACMFSMIAALSYNLDVYMTIAGSLVEPVLLYCSYVIQRPSMVPWFKWYSYMNPVLFGFEALITSEFHDLDIPCSETDLIPNGESYDKYPMDNKVCAFVGNKGAFVNGNDYLKLSFEYTYAHVWRNFGILILFTLGFIVINLILVEIYHPVEASGDVLVFVEGGYIPQLENMDDEDEGNSKGNNGVADIEAVDTSCTVSPTRQTNKVSKEYSQDDDDKKPKIKLGSGDIFTWQNLDYVIQYDGSDRKLLDNVQGYVKPGTLTALMGESGAGKTTLLNALSKRTEVGVITGDMLVNGDMIGASFKRQTGYVQQQDVHVTELTVRESLIFAARLRRPITISDEEKISYVDEIIEVLEMYDYRDAIVGTPGYGLNVEQRKKLSIAVELVSKPELLLFLDEPTSGLDSQSSWAIIQVLRQLAKAGQAILCTIHQPSATLFESFDSLLLLKVGGKTVYFGDIGPNSQIVLNYFENQGARKCQSHENPAEYVLEVIGAGATATVDEDWNEIWVNSDQFKNVSLEIQDIINSTNNNHKNEKSGEIIGADRDDGDKSLESSYATPYWYQLKYCILRGALQLNRNVSHQVTRFIYLLTTGLFVGFSYWNVKHTLIGNQNVMFAVLFAITTIYTVATTIQFVAINGRDIFEVRESKSSTFHWSILFIVQYVNELPSLIFNYTIFFISWYFPIQLDNSPSRAGFWWFSICFVYQFWFLSFALGLAYISPNVASASILFSFLTTVCLLFSGIFQPISYIPGFWKFMWRASPLTYAMEIGLVPLLHGREITCNSIELSYLNPPQGMTCGEYLSDYFQDHSGYVYNSEATSQCGICKFNTGDEYLKSISMSWGNRWRDVGILYLLTVFDVLITLLLYYLIRIKKIDFFKMFSSIFNKNKK